MSRLRGHEAADGAEILELALETLAAAEEKLREAERVRVESAPDPAAADQAAAAQAAAERAAAERAAAEQAAAAQAAAERAAAERARVDELARERERLERVVLDLSSIEQRLHEQIEQQCIRAAKVQQQAVAVHKTPAHAAPEPAPQPAPALEPAQAIEVQAVEMEAALAPQPAPVPQPAPAPQPAPVPQPAPQPSAASALQSGPRPFFMPTRKRASARAAAEAAAPASQPAQPAPAAPAPAPALQPQPAPAPQPQPQPASQPAPAPQPAPARQPQPAPAPAADIASPPSLPKRQRHVARTLCIVLALVLVCALGLAGAAYFKVLRLPDPIQNRIELLPDVNAHKGRLTDADPVAAPGGFQLILNQAPVVDSKSLELPILFENPPSSEYAARLKLALDETGEIVASTRRVSPGMYVEHLELERTLEPGVHAATALVDLYAGNTCVNTMSTAVSITAR